MSGCADFWEWFCDLVIRSEEADPFDEEGEALPVARTSNLSSDQGRFKRERMKQLFNRHGYNLAVFPGGNIKGVRDAFSPHAVLELISVSVGEVRIRSVETGLFLSMGSDGKVRAESSADSEETVFIENVSGPYLTYLSKKYAHHGWHLGIKQSGEVKNGRRTWRPWGQKAVLFVHRRPFADPRPLRQLLNRHGFRLAIFPDGRVEGIRESGGGVRSGSDDKFTVLEFSPSSPPGAFRMRGVESDLFLAMDEKGRLYGEGDRLNNNVLFTEHAQGRYLEYLSVRWAHFGWHIGIKKSGKAKHGQRTWNPSHQKAIQFVHQRPHPPAPTEGDIGAALGNQVSPPLAFIDEDDDDLGGESSPNSYPR